MTENFVNIPYVHVYPNMNYYFDFKGERYNVKSKQHRMTAHDLVLKEGKRWAMRVYYDYYSELKMLPTIDFATIGDQVQYNFTHEGQFFTGVQSNLEDVFDDALKQLFTTMRIKGVR